MYKKLMALLLAAMMLLAAGCKKDTAPQETTEPSRPLETETTPVVIPEETISGVEILDEPLNSPFDGMEDTEPETTENSSPSDNTISNNASSNTEKPAQSGNETVTEPTPTEPVQSEPGATVPEDGINQVSYETYSNMTPAEQMAFYNQFTSMEAFVQWYNEAKAEYDREHGAIDVGDGDIDLGDIINP